MSNLLNGLDSSVPANNQKIIELYNKMRADLIHVNDSYQRKLVWKKNHKIKFIETILKNYPFPEVYLAQGGMDSDNLTWFDEIVDGQQRLTTIREYIEGTDVFSSRKISIPKFTELTTEEKGQFLNYEVSVRYLKNASQEQIKDIFQRINRTEYSLNAVERLNAQWGESEFVCFAKQIIEKDFAVEDVRYLLTDEERNLFLEFFHGQSLNDLNMSKDGVFSENDMSRMLSLQYIMTLVSTIIEGSYSARNDKVGQMIERYNEEFYDAETVKMSLIDVINFINGMNLSRYSMWFNKAHLFTLICEICKREPSTLNLNVSKNNLEEFEHKVLLSDVTSDTNLSPNEVKFIEYGREAVNEKSARDFRGEFVSALLQ